MFFGFFLKGENKGLAWQQKQLVHVASRLRAIRISQKSVCIKYVAIETNTLSASGLPQHHYHLIWLLMLHSGQISLYWSWFHRTKKAETILEPVCCKKQQKKVPDQLLACGIGDPLILKGKKLILDDQGNHLDSYTINLESFRSFRGPLFCKLTGQELFLLFLIASRL